MSLSIDTRVCLSIGVGVVLSIDVDLVSSVDDKLPLLGSLFGFSGFLYTYMFFRPAINNI